MYIVCEKRGCYRVLWNIVGVYDVRMYMGVWALYVCRYSKISIIRTMIIRISGLIQTLMNVRFLM